MTYTNVTLGAAGALGGTGDTAATFDGSTSYVQLPDDLVRHDTYLAVEPWFKTTSPGVLFGYQGKTMTDPQVTSSGTTRVPALYVGTDGKLCGQFWNGVATPLTSSALVNDGQWHQAVISAAGDRQTLYLDGVAVGDLIGQVSQLDMMYDYVGAGADFGNWPAHPADPLGHFARALALGRVGPRRRLRGWATANLGVRPGRGGVRPGRGKVAQQFGAQQFGGAVRRPRSTGGPVSGCPIAREYRIAANSAPLAVTRLTSSTQSTARTTVPGIPSGVIVT